MFDDKSESKNDNLTSNDTQVVSSTTDKPKKKYYRRPERSIFSIHQSVKEDEDEVEKDINTDIDNSLPQDNFTTEDFKDFWTAYMTKIKSKNKPLFNVLDTAKWRITSEKNVELTFDSSVMILEFEKSKEDFIKKVRKHLNNYGVSIRTKINKSQKIKNHIKSRKDIYEDLVKMNPVVDILRQRLELDIENEPE